MYLDWEKQAHKIHVIDIEADGLVPSVIYVMCTRNLKTKEKEELTNHKDIEKWLKEKEEEGCIFVGHNILKFDGPVLNRFFGTTLSSKNCIDTLVLSTLYNPSIVGGHSLGAWGERLGISKIEFNDWSKLSPDMITYCHRDVEATCVLFQRLMRTLGKINFSEKSIWIQHRITEVLDKQNKNGFEFNGPEALSLYRELREIEKGLGDEIRERFPSERTLVAERNKFKKDKSLTSIYLKDKERYILDEDGSDDTGIYRAYEDIQFNVGSPKQRIDKLLSLGWEPREYTDKGNPKPFESGSLSPSLEEFLEDKNIPEVNLIAKWMIVNGRANMINTWLDAWNEVDSKIHGKLFTANTLRFRHQAPNTANIPAVRLNKEDNKPLLRDSGDYTYEARDLWIAREGRVLVGTDASGLELRMLAHYLNRPDFTDSVVNGDPHQYNADLAGVTRTVAKTLIYAVLYGAGGPKIAKTLGLPVFIKKGKNGTYEVSPEGDEMKNMFLEKLGAKDLVEECKAEQKKGRIELVDGSQVICPSPHAALNYKLQGGGARVMSLGAILLDIAINKYLIDSLKVGDIHDEWQHDVAIEDAYVHAALAEEVIVKAGVKLNMNVPLDAESKIGLTWAETH